VIEGSDAAKIPVLYFADRAVAAAIMPVPK
jgi:hypothetical protein